MPEALIDANATIHAENQKGQIPLHLAAKKGNIPTVGVSPAFQSDIHGKDKQRFPPLHTNEQNRSESVTRALLESKQTTEFPTINIEQQSSIQFQTSDGGEYFTKQISGLFKPQPPDNPVSSVYTHFPQETLGSSSGSVCSLLSPYPSISMVSDKNKGQADLLEGVNRLPSSKVVITKQPTGECKLLGQGTFGKVYEGYWGQIPVAIKEINLEAIKIRFSGNGAGKNLSKHEIEGHTQHAWQW
jgi:hypothetical protein